MENRLAGRNGGRLVHCALAAILLLGLGLRLGEAWDGRPPVYDAQAYSAIAASLDRGEGFSAGPTATQPSSNYSPGLPLLLAGIYEVTGGVHERAARVLLALLGTLAVLFTYLIARRLCRAMHLPPSSVVNASRGEVAGLVGALAVAVYPALLEYQGMTMGEPLATTLLSGAVLGIFWARDPGRPRWAWAVPGLLLGALTLVRPEYLAVSILLALVVLGLDARASWRLGLARAGILLAGLLVVLAPWAVRNAIALDRFVPVSTGGGQVLFAGTYLPSDGDPERVGEEVVARHPELFAPGAVTRLRLEQILARLAAARYPGLETDQALSRMGREALWDDVSEEPLEYAGFLATKIGRTWSHGPRDVMREPVWEALHWALLGFGLLGLAILSWRRRWEALVLATIFGSITAISALLVASPRRVVVMVPLLAALAGAGATWAWSESSARRHARTAAAQRRASLSRP